MSDAPWIESLLDEVDTSKLDCVDAVQPECAHPTLFRVRPTVCPHCGIIGLLVWLGYQSKIVGVCPHCHHGIVRRADAENLDDGSPRSET